MALLIADHPGRHQSIDSTTPCASAKFLGDRIATIPNFVTLTRTVISVTLAAVALGIGKPHLLVVAYAVYWAGDMLDGWCARRFDQETRLGAVFDIVSDRACTSLLCAGLIVHLPGTLAVVVAFFLSFMVLDTILSLAFLCWPIVSPNYFSCVDRTVYLLNWSPLAKGLNTAGVVLLALVGLLWASLGLVLAIAGVKIWSLARVQRRLQEEHVEAGG